MMNFEIRKISDFLNLKDFAWLKENTIEFFYNSSFPVKSWQGPELIYKFIHTVKQNSKSVV